MAAQAIPQTPEDRSEPRDEVYHRTRLTSADRRVVSAVVVNLSPHGLMARADAEIATGETVTLTLPVVGTVAATVRWSLGGRIGCRLDRAIDADTYRALLAATGG